jgi:hypothetical protein
MNMNTYVFYFRTKNNNEYPLGIYAHTLVNALKEAYKQMQPNSVIVETTVYPLNRR